MFYSNFLYPDEYWLCEMLNFTGDGDCFKGISYLIWMLRRQGKDNRNLLRSQNSNGHVFRKSPKKQNDSSFFTL